MAAKNKSPALRDFHEALTAHIEGNRLAHESAEKCLTYRELGKTAQSKSAEHNARQWLRKLMVFEAWAETGKPKGGRTAQE
jgi:hypothetical protein